MRRKSALWIVVSGILFSIILAGCNGEGESGSEGSGAEGQTEEINLNEEVQNDGEIIEDGSLTYGLVSDSPFEGILNSAFLAAAPDGQVVQFFDEALLAVNKDFEITNDGAATFEMSDDNKTITIQIKDNVNWHDGEPVKAEDLQFAYEVIGSPDYIGSHYGSLIQMVEGMDAYNSGEADDISGIEINDEKTLSITYTEASPAILNGIWSTPLPKHYLGDISVPDIPSSKEVRENPIGFGPFKVDRIVAGESVQYSRNDDYWKGKPKLASITLKIVNPNTVLQSLESGEVDIAETFPTDQYPNAADGENYQIIGGINNSYTYLSFKLGHYDTEKKENVMDRPKLQNKDLRKAMGYALDMEQIAENFYHGLSFPATTLIVPFFEGYHDETIEGFPYNVEKAEELLDEAGYVDVDGDGFREDPDGEEFIINFLARSGSDTSEPMAKYFIQSWNDIGLNVELVDGRLHEFNSFNKMVDDDEQKVDVFISGWGVGTDVDPSGIYGRKMPYNNSRFVSEKNDELLEAALSEEAFDTERRKEIYNEWQAYMYEESPVIPILYSYKLLGVNNRVKDYSFDTTIFGTWEEVGVTEETAE